MGGTSRSSSSAQTNTTTQNLNIQGAEGPVVAGEGNSQTVNYTETDHGAVDAAFEVIDNVSADTQKTLRDLNADVLNFASGSQSESLKFAAEASRAAYDWANESVKTEVAQSYDRLIKYSAGAVTLIGVTVALAKSRGKPDG